jgi:hypothetical protein
MEIAMLMRHLATAEIHVCQGERHIDQQRKLVAELERDGHASAVLARQLLRDFEALQQQHIQTRNLLRGEIERAKRAAR